MRHTLPGGQQQRFNLGALPPPQIINLQLMPGHQGLAARLALGINLQAEHGMAGKQPLNSQAQTRHIKRRAVKFSIKVRCDTCQRA